MKQPTHRFLSALALAAVAATLVACGGSESSATDGRQAADRAQLDFARCMRRNGVNIPDPAAGDKGTIRLRAPQGMSPGRMETAHRRCAEHLEKLADGGGRPADDPELRDQALRFAQCMRRNGVNIPDPDFKGGGVVLKIRPGAGPNADSTRFREAERRCRRFAPGPEGEGGSGATPQDPVVAEGPSGG